MCGERDTTLSKLLWASFSKLPRFLDTSPHLQFAIPRLLTEYRKTPTTLQDLQSEWKGPGGLWIAQDSHRLVGLLRMDPFRTYWRLSSFVVDPMYRGKRYGEAMLHVATTSVVDPVSLQVLQDNPAHQLYERMGFETDCVSDGRLLMTLRNK